MRAHSPDLITTREAAEILGVIPRRVRQLVAAGRLPGRCYGHDMLLPRDAVLRLAAERERIARERVA